MTWILWWFSNPAWQCPYLLKCWRVYVICMKGSACRIWGNAGLFMKKGTGSFKSKLSNTDTARTKEYCLIELLEVRTSYKQVFQRASKHLKINLIWDHCLQVTLILIVTWLNAAHTSGRGMRPNVATRSTQEHALQLCRTYLRRAKHGNDLVWATNAVQQVVCAPLDRFQCFPELMNLFKAIPIFYHTPTQLCDRERSWKCELEVWASCFIIAAPEILAFRSHAFFTRVCPPCQPLQCIENHHEEVTAKSLHSKRDFQILRHLHGLWWKLAQCCGIQNRCCRR